METSLKGSIVIVDDEIERWYFSIQMLRKLGFRVLSAPDGRRALAAIRKVPPDLILLNVIMPEMDGYEVCRILKSDTLTRDIPVIFTSALQGEEDKAKAFSVGGADWLQIPFLYQELLVRVEIHLTLRKMQKALETERRERKRVESFHVCT